LAVESNPNRNLAGLSWLKFWQLPIQTLKPFHLELSNLAGWLSGP